MITAKLLEELKVNNYVRKASHIENYWVDFSRSKLDSYASKGNNFHIIIYSELNSDDHYYIIPFSSLKQVFTEKYMSHDKNNRKRWIGTIIDNKLKFSNHPIAIDVQKYYLNLPLIESQILIEKRISRLTWNVNGWVKPSGPVGKSKDSNSHEAKHGYGHEEWLFDTGKLIGDFHYGFLESVRKEQDAYSGKMFNVWLYSINGETKERFWIGEINNLIVLNRKEAEWVYQTYLEKGWIREMEEQIRRSGANEKGFSNWNGVDVFNIKFRPKDIKVNDPYFLLPPEHEIVGISRYVFGHYKEEYSIALKEIIDSFEFASSEANYDEEETLKGKKYTRQPKAIEIIYWHKAISSSLTKTLRQIYGVENVTREHLAGYGGNKIDIVVKDKDGLIFYEIKTYNSIKTSIREALGQLFEYCFFPNKQKAIELVIVSHLPADDQTKLYIQHLREFFKFQIYYQSYDLEAKLLSEKH